MSIVARICLEVASIKVIHNKQTGFSEGYGFVEFFTHASTEKVLSAYSCMTMPNVEQPFRLNWATFSMGNKRANKVVFATVIFLSDEDLRQPFAQYGEIVSIKIPVGKGCGFVQFTNRNDADEALQKLNGTAIGKQTVCLSWGRNPANKHNGPDERSIPWNTIAVQLKGASNANGGQNGGSTTFAKDCKDD